MVFGFGKKKNKDAQEPPALHSTPSLPDLSQARQAIVWPTSLVDQEEMQQARTIPYHKPFRPSSSAGPDEHGRNVTRFPTMSEGPPSAFLTNRMSTVSSATSGTRKHSSRRPKLAPSFNIMVAGGKLTGKTSFLRLMLETADIAPTATMEQRAELESFLAHKPKRTTAFQSVKIEVMDSPTDRLMLNVIDTPGLDFNHGRELVLEQQTNALVHEIESKFAETLIEESKVVRTSKGDQHVHLCVYLIDPVASIIDRKHEARHTDLQQHTPPNTSPLNGAVVDSDSESDSEPDSPSPGPHKETKKGASHISLRPAEIRTLRRLAPKVNLLPVIARIDSMTDARLRDVKKAVRRELQEAGIGFGVFSLDSSSGEANKGSHSATLSQGGEAAPDVATTPASPISPDDSDGEDAPGSFKKQVIKIRSTRLPAELSRKRSQSRIRRAHMQSNESDEEFEIARAKASIKERVKLEQQQQRSEADYDARKKRMSFASMRFFDHTRALLSKDMHDRVGGVDGETSAAQREVDRLLPFALVNPEKQKRRRPTSFQPSVGSHPDSMQQDGDSVPPTPGLPETSLFTRKFRWGTIDVLNADHCDFVPMRTAIFGSHLKVLRKSTKDAYERFRTEKLLLRKARKMRASLNPGESSTGISREGSETPVGTLEEGGSWVDVAGVKVYSATPAAPAAPPSVPAPVPPSTQGETLPRSRRGSLHSRKGSLQVQGNGTPAPDVEQEGSIRRKRRNTLTKRSPSKPRPVKAVEGVAV